MNNIDKLLSKLESESNLRRLRTAINSGKSVIYDGIEYLDMSSNDYLGVGCDMDLQREFLDTMANESSFVMSNSASRLMSGNSVDYDELEASLAALYTEKSCLVLSSGYAVNSAVLPALTSKDDLVLADKLVHASIIDGLRLCQCEWGRYRHNDMEHLEMLIKKHLKSGAIGDIWVVTESVFSMDGDRAPIAELIELKQKYGIKLYLDEAHAFGVFGGNGAGLSMGLGVDEQVDIIVGTLGKAVGACGGFIVLQPLVRELLINKMRTLIYSTALPPINLRWAKLVVSRLPLLEPRREHLKSLIARFGRVDATQIIPIMAYENSAASDMAERFREFGFWVTPIRFPTVPAGKARIRVSLSAAMSHTDIDKFIEACKSIG